MDNAHSSTSLLKLNHDVLLEICQIVNEQPRIHGDRGRFPLECLSSSNKALRDISTPEVFREIAIRGDWKRAEKLVKEMQGYLAIAQYTRTFKFDIYDPNHEPPKSLPAQLARLMALMAKLTKLVFVVPENHISIFETAFKDSGLVLPEIKIVVVGPFAEFIISRLPNVTTVSSNGWQWLHSEGATFKRIHFTNLITAVAEAKSVTRLEIMEWWQEEQVKAVIEKLPNLRYLTIDGGQYQINLDQLLILVSLMPKLETLALASVFNLPGLNFDGGPRCVGNAYMGPEGEKLRRKVAEQAEEAGNKAAGMVLKAFQSHDVFKNLWLGDQKRFEFVRDENGMLKDYVIHVEQQDKIVSVPKAVNFGHFSTQS